MAKNKTPTNHKKSSTKNKPSHTSANAVKSIKAEKVSGPVKVKKATAAKTNASSSKTTWVSKAEWVTKKINERKAQKEAAAKLKPESKLDSEAIENEPIMKPSEDSSDSFAATNDDLNDYDRDSNDDSSVNKENSDSEAAAADVNNEDPDSEVADAKSDAERGDGTEEQNQDNDEASELAKHEKEAHPEHQDQSHFKTGTIIIDEAKVKELNISYNMKLAEHIPFVGIFLYSSRINKLLYEQNNYLLSATIRTKQRKLLWTGLVIFSFLIVQLLPILMWTLVVKPSIVSSSKTTAANLQKEK